MSSNKGLQNNCHPNQQPATPSITKRKQVQQSNGFRSPTDSVMSPCSQRLLNITLKDQALHMKKSKPKSVMDGKENEMS